ncbi:plasmalemma vesicle-associated protein isoform X1 [Cygnus olor]|uniref:plasmalemma vesicle-associated protein isoform X1 n=1 Tax=Cygnus olor TaxID=8869 RepID=UPI001ADE8DAC|nr:plasmalemma vesicle-associated protein isoform X1 [Cygnus olor]
MEKSSYAMAKFGLEAKEAMPKRDCGFYMKYVFLFTSLIQFLIILGLVLFMVYGNAHAGTDTHLRLLEEQMQDRYNKIITLSGRNANLTRTLNNTLKEKQGLQGTLQKVQRELDKCNSSQLPNATPKLQEMMRIMIYQKMMLEDYHMTINLINANCSGKGAPTHPPPPSASHPPPPQPSGESPAPPGHPPRSTPLPRGWAGTSPHDATWGGRGCGRRRGTVHPQPSAPPPRAAEKAQLRSQLDKTALARKELEDNCAKTSTALAKASQEREGCQQELLSTQTLCDSTKSHLELLKRECSILRPDISISLQRIRETISPYGCSSAHEELRRLTQRTEGLFLQQQERDTMYREKSACDVNLLQCRFNCSREKQELEKRLQEADKQLKGGQEEKKKLLAEKEQLSKEVGEKSKAAVQANYLKQRLSICEGSKLDTFDITGSWVPGTLGGSVRPGPFASPSSYADPLRNLGIFGSAGKNSMEEMQRLVQKMMEQYMATLKNPSG